MLLPILCLSSSTIYEENRGNSEALPWFTRWTRWRGRLRSQITVSGRGNGLLRPLTFVGIYADPQSHVNTTSQDQPYSDFCHIIILHQVVPFHKKSSNVVNILGIISAKPTTLSSSLSPP